VSEPHEQQRELFRLWPSGVAVVVAESGGRRAGLTVSSLLSLSLEPPLVSIALSRSASLYEVVRDAGEWAVSILDGSQGALARHFALNVPPIAHWDRIEVLTDEPRLIAGALGWIVAETIETVLTGDHALFIGAVRLLERGPGRDTLVYVDRRYRAL
jgi:flavin reductase (DIM6/NTAB) family NADH-FMN oxidoreductase RutF